MNKELIKPSTHVVTRREFISATARAGALAAAATAFPFVSRGKVLGANDRIGVGFIGVGGRGGSHVATVRNLIRAGEKLQVVAVCDAFRYRLDEAAKPTGAKAYMKHAELLADPNVDVVCIATPDRLHVPQAIDAIRAGKDVYCEKPMGHWTQFDSQQAVLRGNAEAEAGGADRQPGQLQPGLAEGAGAGAARGAVGRVQLVNAGFYRYGDWGERMPIPDPEAKPGPDLDWEAFLGDAPKVPFTVDRFFSWRKYLDYAGGPCTDLFPHVFTPFVSAIGLKFPAARRGLRAAFSNTPPTTAKCRTPSTCAWIIRRSCRWWSSRTLANDYVTEPAIHGDEGTITLQNPGRVERGHSTASPSSRAKASGKVFPMQKSDATSAHWQNFLNCVRTREKPVSDVEFGLHVQAALNMAMLSLLKDKVVKFDFAKNEIVA